MASVNILRSRNAFTLVCIVISAITETTGVHLPRKSHIGFFQGPCDRTTLCEHQCISLTHGYMCECREGYQLNTDGCTCSEIPTTLSPTTSKTHRIVPKVTVSKAQNDEVFQLHDIIRYQPHLDVDPNASIDRSSNLYAGAKTHKNYNGKSVYLDSNELNAIYDVNRLPHPCDDVQCKSNGSCVNDGSSVRCDCPLGTTGDRCQNNVQVRYPRFEGKGFLALPVLHNAYKDFRIKLEFRPESLDGLLLFTSEQADARNDFFSIALIKGHVLFRFDCGTGAATMQTKGQVTLGKWNTVHVTRRFRSGTLSLNDEAAVTNSSKGDFMRLTLRQNLYLGGYQNVSQISRRTGTHNGFHGCVNSLSINNYKYDFRKGELIGDAQFGINLDECSSELCQEELQCQNGGECVAVSADRVICRCLLGFTGLECEREHAQIQIPDFNGHSYLQYKGLQRNALSYTEIEVILKPMSMNGLILYNGYTTDRKGDFIALAMRDGYLEFRFDLGTGPAIIRSPRPLALGQWHTVSVSRTGLDGVMEIAGQPRVEGLSRGAYTQLTLLLDLYIGGHRNYDETSKYANISDSFVGCIQSVFLNKKQLRLIDDALDGVNVDSCDHPCSKSPCDNGGECVPYSHSYSCTCPLGFYGKTCQEKTSKSLSVPKFDGSSYLVYSDPKVVRRTRGRQVDIQLMVRPTSRDGLLIWASGKVTKSHRHPDFMTLGFVQGSLQFSYDLGSGPAIIIYNQTDLFDGDWHHIRAQRDKWDGFLAVDHTSIVEGSSPKPTESLNTDKLFHIGGGINVAQMTRKKYSSGFIGCLSKVTLATDYELNLIDNAATGRNIQSCSCESIFWQDKNNANGVSIDCSHNL